MLPVVQKSIAVTISHGPGRKSSQETQVPAKWSQRHICDFSPEVLSHIFGFLGCDDIAHMHDTCLLFRKVVLSEYAQTFSYSQLPQLFREQYQQSWSCQKQTVRNGQHPFVTALPNNKSKFFNSEHRTASLCVHTLREMMSTSVYRPMQVFTCNRLIASLRVDCSLSSSNLLLHNFLDGGASVLSRDGADSWSEEIVDMDESGMTLLGIPCPRSGGDLRFNFCFHNAIEYLKRDGDCGRWQLSNQQWVMESDEHELSPSGRYMACYTYRSILKEIRCLDDQGQWVLMPMAEGVRIDSGFYALRFSPSGQHLVIQYSEKLAVMSLDSQGCWNFTWTPPKKKHISYINFCPSDRWLLVGYGRSTADIIRLDPAGKCISQQEIVCEDCMPSFSPAGNYLVNSINDKGYGLLWRLLKSGEWVLDDNLIAPETGTLSVGEKDPEINIILFSPCDNYLLTGYKGGVVEIWGQKEQRYWVGLGRKQHDGALRAVKFSPSGVHALTVDESSIHIWGRDEYGLWLVKGSIPVPAVWNAHFHPVAEHLIVVGIEEGVQVWELRKGDTGEEADGPEKSKKTGFLAGDKNLSIVA